MCHRILVVSSCVPWDEKEWKPLLLRGLAASVPAVKQHEDITCA